MNHAYTSFIITITILASELLTAAENRPSHGSAEAPVTKPNIVYIMVDDMGYADVGFNGCKDICTPNLDKLAKQGAILDSFYTQPVCSPGRAAMLTGRYPVHTGIYNVVNPRGEGLRGPLPLTERTLAQALHEVGYTTAICGKWHLGADSVEYRPTRRGFDSQYGLYGGAISYLTHKDGKGIDWWRNDELHVEQGYSTTLLGDEACRVINAQPAGKPLFLYVAPNAVHGPLDATDEMLKPYEHLPKKRLKLVAATEALDHEIGRIVAALDARDMSKNTIIVFSSDNGGPSWNGAADNGPLRGGKSDIYEGGMRVCAFVTWPGRIPAGTRITEPLHAVDWFPTFCALADASTQQMHLIDGIDIMPVLAHGAKSPREAIPLIGSRDNQFAIRMGDWKLLINPAEFKRDVTSSAVELYNLAEDLGEQKNLAETQTERVKDMRACLDKLMANAVHPEFFKSNKADEKTSKSSVTDEVDE